MIHAYDKNYLEKAKTTMAHMLDYVVYDLHYDMGDFFQLFIESGMARRFEKGDSRTIAGHSGVELAREVLERSGQTSVMEEPRYAANRSREYWTGYVLAYYQWYSGKSFAEITAQVSVEQIRELYSPYHEMDIRQFAERMDELCQKAQPETRLKVRRVESGLSQRELAESTGVPLRTLQEYEQGRKDISKAQVTYLIMLAKALCCEVEDLVE